MRQRGELLSSLCSGKSVTAAQWGRHAQSSRGPGRTLLGGWGRGPGRGQGCLRQMLRTKYKGPWGCGPCGQAEGAGKAVGMGRGQGWREDGADEASLHLVPLQVPYRLRGRVGHCRAASRTRNRAAWGRDRAGTRAGESWEWGEQRQRKPLERLEDSGDGTADRVVWDACPASREGGDASCWDVGAGGAGEMEEGCVEFEAVVVSRPGHLTRGWRQVWSSGPTWESPAHSWSGWDDSTS